MSFSVADTRIAQTIPQALHKGDANAVGYLQSIENAIKSNTSTNSSNSTSISALDTRVTALENPVTSTTPTQFITADQTITASTAIAGIAHGLTLTSGPGLQAFLVNQSTEFGYNSGDLLGVSTNLVDFFNAGDSTHHALGCSVSLDATNVYITYGNGAGTVFEGINRTTGAIVALTNANWKLRVVVNA